MNKLVNINGRLVNPDSVTYIIDREIVFNNGHRWVATEPEIQELLAVMFETPRPVPTAPVVAKKAVKKK